MSLRVLLVSGRTEIEEILREDPGAPAYWTERRPPELVVPAEAAREFAIVLVDFDTAPDGLALSRALRTANRSLEVIAIAGPERERAAVESLKGGVFDYLLWPAPESADLWELLARAAKKVQPDKPEFPIAYGRYTLLELLGVGGMAEVFLASLNERSERRAAGSGLAETASPPGRVVVKRMLQSLAGGDEFVAMFMDEARISSMLVHPNIVKVHDFGRVDDSLYIAMEYIPGRNLEQMRLALGGPFPPALACYIVAELCAGLGHAHTKVDNAGVPLGIVHRDVNPPNVLVADDGRVMITDFGIAKAAHRYYETTSGTLKGKFEYMSPEQANGKPVDRRADVFCAGLVLYELLCGTRPFMAPTPIETLFLIQECRPDPPSKWNARLPKVLDEICMRALAKDPAARYSEASELERDLREYARGSMNPGPRDLAVFAKGIGRARPDGMSAVVPAAPSASDGEAAAAPVPAGRPDSSVTALLQRMKKKEEARTGDGVALLEDDGPTAQRDRLPTLIAPRPSPLVRAAAASPPLPVKPPAANARPSVGAPAAKPPAPKPSEPSRTTTAPVGKAHPVPAAPPTITDNTMPGVLAELEALAQSPTPVPEPTPAPELTPPPTAPPPTARAGAPPASEAGTVVGPPVLAIAGSGAVPAAPDGAGATEAPKTPAKTVTGSGELFPPSAKAGDRARMQMQLAVGAGAGLLLVVLVFAVGPGNGWLFAEPTPYLALATPTPVSSATAVAPPSATPEPSPDAASPAPTLPAETPSPTPVRAETPAPTPVRTAVTVATPRPTPVRTAVQKGTLSIWVDGWATVEIDGRSAGKAPFVGLSLPAGKHRVVLRNSANVRRQVEVVVRPNRETKISVDFR